MSQSSCVHMALSKQLIDRGDLDFKYGYTYFQSLPYFFPGQFIGSSQSKKMQQFQIS